MDTIANVLTHIRNASAVKKQNCLVRHSKMAEELLKILKKAGYIADYKIEEKGIKKNIRIFLSYDVSGKSVIREIKRVSKPGRRVYSTIDKLPKVLGGIGILVLTTNKGLMTDKEAREAGIGGEVMCEIY